MLSGKTVLLGVTGGIACYKAAALASALVKQHCDVQVVMTRNATEFLTPVTFEQLTGNRVAVDTFDRNHPSQVGADLLVDAAAALSLYKPPLVIFDMGTATTMSVLDAQGNYIGEVIVPGLRLSMDALSSRAAQLPFINLDEPPERLIGKNTVDCMKAGAIYSNAAMLDGLVDRVEEELGEPVTVVATGGLMGVVLPFCKHTVHYDENLLLIGLLKLYQRNA